MSDNNIRKIKHLSFNKETETANIITDDQVEISAIATDELVSPQVDSVPAPVSPNIDSSAIEYDQPERDYPASDQETPIDDYTPTPATKVVSGQQKENTKVGTKFGFGGLFGRDQEEVGGAKRVMQKSILFLAINLISFALLILSSIGIFNSTSNILIASGVLVGSMVLFAAVTNVFFIILSNRLYLLALLVFQTMLIISLNALTGQGLSIPTAVVTLLSVMMTYLAYLELEKNQLSSRIFNVSHIATESTRILTTASILLVGLGLFNYIIFTGTQNGEFEGAENFVSKTFLSQNRVVDGILIGLSDSGGRASGINNYFMSRSLTYRNNRLVLTADSSDATFKDFLRFNYKTGENLLPQDELDALNNRCTREKISPCDQLINQVRDQKLEAWRVEGYGQLTNLNLNSPMNLSNFRDVTKQFYQNLITDTGRENAQSRATANIPLISNFSPKYIVPMLLVFVVFVILMILRPILNAVVIFLSWVIWNILKLSGYAKIEVETVESEVVSI